MNEKIIKDAFKLIFHIFGIFFILLIIFLLGLRNYNDSGTIRQLEDNTRELRKENSGFKLGFDIISRESRERGKINTELRNTVGKLEKDKRRYTDDLDRIYRELESTNRELDRIRRETEARSQEAIRESEEIRREIDNFGKIIESIEKGKND